MEVSPETLKVNDTVTLGRYYINDDTHKEPVEWRVLALKDHKALPNPAVKPLALAMGI